MSSRTWGAWSVTACVLLVSPVLGFFAVIAAEVLIDLLATVGALVILAFIAAGALGWALFRRLWQLPDWARQSGPEVVADETAIAAPPV